MDSIAPSYHQQLIQYVQRRSAGEQVPKFYEARGMKVDGTEFDAEFNVSTYELHGEIYSVAVIRDITERKRSEDALRISVEQLHALTMRLENIREEERKSMSREVHDELGQILTALRMDLMSLKKSEVTEVNFIRARLQSMLDLTANAIRSVQDISARLRPGMLDDLGLAAAIEWQVEEFQKRSGISCALQMPEHDLEVDDERSTVLFRILQETLTNVARHAQAKHITVSLVDSKNELVMTLQDDGIGISDELIRNPKSLGLLGNTRTVASVSRSLFHSTRSRWGNRSPRPTSIKDIIGTSNMVRILIVDDHPIVRHGLKSELARASDVKVVDEAADGSEAIAKARSSKPDLVLLDIALPGKMD